MTPKQFAYRSRPCSLGIWATFALLLCLLPGRVAAQVDTALHHYESVPFPGWYWPSHHNFVYDRLQQIDIKAGDSVGTIQIFTDSRPIRVGDVLYLGDIKGGDNSQRFYIDNYFSNESGLGYQGRGLFGTFYRQPAFLYSVEGYRSKTQEGQDHNQWFIGINPVIGWQAGWERGNTRFPYRNTRGAEVKGFIDDGKLSFYSYLAENQYGLPNYIDSFYDHWGVMPGEGYTKPFKTYGVDFFTTRAYVSWQLHPYINATFGNDRHFIGFGERSMLLGNFAKDFVSLKMTTRFWKFQYQNIFAQLTDFYPGQGIIKFSPKYAAFHYLSLKPWHWLNVGLFEGVVFNNTRGATQGYAWQYLNPVIFYRAAEHNLGSHDNVVVGANMGIDVARQIRLYGQLLLDEFVLGDLRDQPHSIRNKYGIQAGAYWTNPFGLPNLYLRGEFNMARPFTYSSDTSADNYSHWGQPLAHPLGANFREVLGAVEYYPMPRLQVQGKVFLMQQGRDTGQSNYGSNIFQRYTRPTPPDPAHPMLMPMMSGQRSNTVLLQGLVSWQVYHNMFIDLNGFTRVNRTGSTTTTNTYIGAGLRLNFVPDTYAF